jgi:hypothetical protein
MTDIKSAREIAEEKLAKLGEATEEERLGWKFVPEGTALGARYLKDDCNLVSELGEYTETGRAYVIKGATEVLARNIDLPRNDAARRATKKAMDGIKLMKTDKAGVENIYSRIRQVFGHYAEQGEQQRRQAYESLKQQMEGRMQQAMQQQLGTAARMRIDVERQPQFQEEWRRMQSQLDAPYIQHLSEYRQELIDIP